MILFRLLREGAVVAVLLCAATSSTIAQTTEQFMNTLAVCAGGINLSINADLLGSVRSLYDGAGVQGRAELKTEAAFLDKIPQSSRLAAMELYHSCIKDILLGVYQITQETLNFKFWIRIPVDMRIAMDNERVDLNQLLVPNGFFANVLNISISYKFSRKACQWPGIEKYNADHDYYFSHGHQVELYPDAISVADKIVGQLFAPGTFVFVANDWKGDKITLKTTPEPSNPLRSVDLLVGKCMYVEIIGPTKYNYRYIDNKYVRSLAERFSDDTFKTLDLTSFSIKLSDVFRVEPSTSNVRTVYRSEYIAIWQVQLPSKINEFRILQ